MPKELSFVILSLMPMGEPVQSPSPWPSPRGRGNWLSLWERGPALPEPEGEGTLRRPSTLERFLCGHAGVDRSLAAQALDLGVRQAEPLAQDLVGVLQVKRWPAAERHPLAVEHEDRPIGWHPAHLGMVHGRPKPRARR